MKNALGMVIKNLVSDTVLLGFIHNAQKFGHKIDCVIVAYSGHIEPQVYKNISAVLPFYTIDVKDPHFIKSRLSRMSLGEKANALCELPIDTKKGLVPYGFNRMTVVIEAMMRGAETLFFIDSDIYPRVLMEKNGISTEEEIDFFGAHLHYLNSESEITTGEYSGYNILPPASFDGMEELLQGVQKQSMIDFWKSSNRHKTLSYQKENPEIKPCKKILGGNVAIKLSVFTKLSPFFSSHYSVDGETFLCRGEDTTLGVDIEKTNTVCTDVGVKPLHDTYSTFPNEPDLRGDRKVQERFYYACTGWVGRNPLFNYMLGNDLKEVREYQSEKLETGLRGLSSYTANPRYLSVMKNFDVSWDSVNRYISEYEIVRDAFRDFMIRMDLG